MRIGWMAICAALALGAAPLRAEAPKTPPGPAATRPLPQDQKARPAPPATTEFANVGTVDSLAILENEVELTFHFAASSITIYFARTPRSEAWIETLKHSLRTRKKLGLTSRKSPASPHYLLLKVYEDR